MGFSLFLFPCIYCAGKPSKLMGGIIVHQRRDNAFLSVQDMLKTNPTTYY